ncbi:MAG TPA: hypothetical protein VEJ84_00025 [Acidimicrobiales bacterium]|nr:hypothetical protein [Acidimicrobiales bacterium]
MALFPPEAPPSEPVPQVRVPVPVEAASVRAEGAPVSDGERSLLQFLSDFSTPAPQPLLSTEVPTGPALAGPPPEASRANGAPGSREAVDPGHPADATPAESPVGSPMTSSTLSAATSSGVAGGREVLPSHPRARRLRPVARICGLLLIGAAAGTAMVMFGQPRLDNNHNSPTRTAPAVATQHSPRRAATAHLRPPVTTLGWSLCVHPQRCQPTQ